jgi:hypothetical protein
MGEIMTAESYSRNQGKIFLFPLGGKNRSVCMTENMKRAFNRRQLRYTFRSSILHKTKDT